MKSKTLKILIAAILIVALLPALNCKKEPDEISVRLKWTYAAGFAGDMVALRKGIFKKNNLGVELHEGGFNLDPIKLVASGSDQIGTAGADQVLLARAQGIPLVVIAVVFQSDQVVFFSKKGSGITTPQDFVGRKVGIKPGTENMPIYEALMKKEGIDRSKIEEIPVQFSLAPFLEDKVDVFPGWTTNQPFYFDKMGLEYNVIEPLDYGIDIYGMCYFTTEKMIEEHPDVVERYLKSVLGAYKWAFENPKEALPIILSYSEKLDTAEVKWQLEKMEPYIMEAPERKVGWMTKEKWEALQQLYLDLWILEQPVNLDSLYTMNFLEKVYK